MRFRERGSKETTSNEQTHRQRRRTIFGFVTLLIVAIGVVLLVGALVAARSPGKSNHWPTTAGQILASTINYRRRSGGGMPGVPQNIAGGDGACFGCVMAQGPLIEMQRQLPLRIVVRISEVGRLLYAFDEVFRPIFIGGATLSLAAIRGPVATRILVLDRIV